MESTYIPEYTKDPINVDELVALVNIEQFKGMSETEIIKYLLEVV